MPLQFFTAHIEKNYKFQVSINALIFSILPFSFVIGSCNYFVNWKTTNGFQIIISSLFMCFSLIFIGPLNYIGLPNSIYIVVLGEVILGIPYSFALIPQFNFILYSIKLVINDLHDVTLNHICSGIYIMVWNFGELIGPLLGGLFIHNYGFSWSMIILLLIFLSIILLFIVFTKGFTYIKRPYEQLEISKN